jgi:outer membrane protein assembly factor BamB
MLAGTKHIISVFSLIIILIAGNASVVSGTDFILPEWGGGMAHCDPNLSDYISLPVPNNDVKILWHRNDLSGEKAGAKGNGIAGNGEIAACTFSGLKDNLVIYDYDGNRLWSSGNLLNVYAFFSAPMVDIHGQVIACDNHNVIMIDTFDIDNDSVIVEWISEIPYGGIPFSPVITEDGTLIIATDRGPIYAYNITDGSLIGWKFLGEDEKIHPIYRLLNVDDPGFFSTINTPCVSKNRIYISTQYKGPRGMPTLRHHARLYAVDIDSDNENISKRINESWYFEFGGPSQASPTIINETIYFDGYREKPSLPRDIHLFALKDKGNNWEEKWREPYPLQTYASFAYDPRGGFWYIDPFGGKLVRFSTDNGDIIEEIMIDNLVDEKGIHLPSSVMTICGNDTNPILIVSASAIIPFFSNSYVIAIDLSNNNSLLWKVKLFQGPVFTMDFAFGQYTILIKDDISRVIFGSFRNGVWAIGTDDKSLFYK